MGLRLELLEAFQLASVHFKVGLMLS